MRTILLMAATSLAVIAPATAQVPQSYNCGTSGMPACPTLQQRTDAARPAPDTKHYGQQPDSGSNQPNVNNSDRQSGKATSPR